MQRRLLHRMILPNKRSLARWSRKGPSIEQGTSIHPKPRFYKYLWQIYTADSPWENDEFFEKAPRLCTHDAMRTISALAEAGKAHIVYNYHLPRRGPEVPFDFESARWRGCKVACAYDDDPDPVWKGFK